MWNVNYERQAKHVYILASLAFCEMVWQLNSDRGNAKSNISGMYMRVN